MLLHNPLLFSGRFARPMDFSQHLRLIHKGIEPFCWGHLPADFNHFLTTLFAQFGSHDHTLTNTSVLSNAGAVPFFSLRGFLALRLRQEQAHNERDYCEAHGDDASRCGDVRRSQGFAAGDERSK